MILSKKKFIGTPKVQSSPAISNSEESRQKVRGSAIFEIARLRDSKITPEENSK